MFKHAIIDADVLVYSCGFAVQKLDNATDILHVEPIAHAFYNVNSQIRRILKQTGTDNYSAFLTGSGNFRYEVDPTYKANRALAVKPFYYSEIKEFIQRRWNAVEVVGQEADDALSILQCKLNPFGFDPDIKNSVICTIDKDLNNTPGWHYNFRKDVTYFVSELDALKNFYLQILTGDPTDNVPRVKKGWRQKTAEDVINKCEKEEEIVEIVRKEVYNIYKDVDLTEQFIKRNGRLVWMRRKEDELWEVPCLKQDQQV